MAKKTLAELDAEDQVETATTDLPWDDASTDKEMVTLYFDWVECRTDPGAYKPLSPLLAPVTTQVAVEIPKSYLYTVDLESGKMILTLEGWAYAQFKIRSVLEKYYQK